MRRQELQDASGVITDLRYDGILEIVQRVIPTDGVKGYATGCRWTNLAGTAGTILYVNQGTNLVSAWLNIA